MSFRWYGKGYDSVSLKEIRQIPGIKGVISTLHNKQTGEIWEAEEIQALKKEIESNGLELYGIESVSVHDAIKTGSDQRDQYIENYRRTLENLGENGVKLVCYSFMPMFGWTRTKLAKPKSDGSTAMAYDFDVIKNMQAEDMFDLMNSQANGFLLPGWEPERLKKFQVVKEQFRGITAEQLFDNLVYFLQSIMPICEKYAIKMAIHPDDPAWGTFGIPRIMKNKEDLVKLLKAVDNPYNGVTFCSGSLGSDPDNNLVEIIQTIKDRIHFVHLRNIQHNGYRSFEETAHLSSEGSFDMFQLVSELHQVGFNGIIRPDHGRTIWNEKAMPGYGLYDRALGTAYLQGLIEAVEKNSFK